MFFDGSRYLGVAEYSVPGHDGRPVAVKRMREAPAAPGAVEYQVHEGDRGDLLAYRFYRNPRRWYLLCDAQPDLLDPRLLVTPGRTLPIPPDRSE